jgi:hypothetical protein
MINKFIKYLSLLFITVIFGCNEPDAPDCLKSTGSIQVQHRELPSFNSIVLEDNINLWLTYGEQNHIRVEAGGNIIDEITTEIDTDGLLTIKNTNSCNWVRSYKVPVNVYIGSKDINFIKHLGYGNVVFQNQWQTDYLEYKHYGAGTLNMNIKAEVLNFDHNGLGKAELIGEVYEAYFVIQHFGPLLAKNLKIKFCSVHNISESDATISCSHKLYAIVYSKGNINYYGNPLEVIKEIKGTGKIIAK